VASSWILFFSYQGDARFNTDQIISLYSPRQCNKELLPARPPYLNHCDFHFYWHCKR